MCNQYMFIFNSKYSSYSLWDGVMRGRLRWSGSCISMGPTGASHRLRQERASLALLTALLLANVWEVPRGASELPSRAQLRVSLGTKGPTCIPIPSHLLPRGAEAALWATHEQDESR